MAKQKHLTKKQSVKQLNDMGMDLAAEKLQAEITADDEKDMILEEAEKVIIEYEHTIATAQFENLKPKVRMEFKTLNKNQAEIALDLCRDLLRDQHIKINKKKNGG